MLPASSRSRASVSPTSRYPAADQRAELLGEAFRGHGEVTQRPADGGHGVVHQRRHGLPCRRRRHRSPGHSSHELPDMTLIGTEPGDLRRSAATGSAESHRG